MAILGKERAKELEAINDGINKLIAMCQQDPNSGRGFNALLMAAKAALEEIVSVMDEKKPVITYNLGGLPELLRALGDHEGEIFPFVQEKIVAQQSLMGDVNINIECFELAEAHGLSSDVCSTDRGILGYLLKGLLMESVCNVFVTAPCDSQVVAVETFKELTGKDFFLIDIPDLHGEREIQYVAGQLKEEIKFLEDKTGKKLNWDRLKEICEESNRMVDVALEWLEYRKTVPCPQTSAIISAMYILLNEASGTKGGTWVASEFLAEAKEKALKGESVVPGGEKIRAVWFGSPIWHNLPFYNWLESELGMVIPVDMFSYVCPEMYIDTSTPESILHDMARKQIYMPMGRHFSGASEYYIDDLLRAVDDYKADCVLLAGHMSCKHALGQIGIIKEAVRKADIPLLTFEFDLFDPRVTSVETLQEEFKRFANDIVLPRLKK